MLAPRFQEQPEFIHCEIPGVAEDDGTKLMSLNIGTSHFLWFCDLGNILFPSEAA